MYIKVLALHVNARTRVKGADYFRTGAVFDIGGAEWMAHALVRGTRDYRVELVRDGSIFTGSCECPYYADRAEICKHIWAALLEADQRGLLSGDGPIDEGEAVLEPEYRPPAFTPSVASSLPMPGIPYPGRVVTPPPPPAWQRFLYELQQDVAAAEVAPPQPRFANGQIIYAIDARETLAGHGTVVNVLFRQAKRNGEWGKSKPAAITPREAEHLVDEDDREILSLMMGAASPGGYPTGSDFVPYGRDAYGRASRFYLSGVLEARLLPMLARSGRAHLAGPGNDRELLPITWDDGPAWRFDLQITANEQEDLVSLDGSFVRGGERLALGEPVLLLSGGFLFTRTRMAQLELNGGFAWIARLRRAGPVSIPRDKTTPLVDALARSGMDPRSLPEELRYDVIEGQPKPRVRVRRPDRRHTHAVRQDLQAAIQFNYDGTIVDGASAASTYDPATHRLIRRHRAAEQVFIDRSHQLGFRYTWSHFESRQILGIAPDQFSRIVNTLLKEGWHVEADGRPFRTAFGMDVRVSSGIDWFDLGGTVDFGEGRSAPFPQLLAALQRGEDVVVLDDGSVGLLPEEWLQRYAAVASLGESDGQRIRFHQSQAALLDALLAAQPGTLYDEVFEKARAELRTFAGVEPEDPPPTFRGTLREYQREALGWFSFLRRFGFGGCLADDMGLGKTVMVLAMLDSRRHGATTTSRAPSLVVVPRSLIFNWIDEALRFAPTLTVLDYSGAARDITRLHDADVVLTTYGTLLRDATALKEIAFDYVILDEAQAIKNASTASAKAARLLKARHRLALSGTPIENHLGELWSLFEFLNPGLLGSSRAFQRASAATQGDADLAWLSRALRPFILRRTKQQVAPELPRRSEQTLHCDLEGTQRRHYDELRAHYRDTLLARVARDGVNRSKMQILEALLRLRQAACHSGLIDPTRAHESSAKFDVLIPRLVEVIEEGHKALVFSQFTSLLALLRPRLEALGIVYEYLDGRTRDRGARVERFQTDPACQLFLISLKAGGIGLNLTAAEYVFLLDPWWNPAVEAQAIDRAHRIGQARHVFAYRLLATDTVEEKVAELQQSKRTLADAILNADAGLVRTLRAEDLERLLA